MYLGITDIKNLASLMDSKLGVQYSRYALTFFRRRLSYLFDKMLIKKVAQFEEMLNDSAASDTLCGNMSIPCTEMFRDPAFWRSLKKLVSQKDINSTLKVYFPEAVSGEELYSFLVIAIQLDIFDKLDVVVQHPSEMLLDRIKAGMLIPKTDAINRSNFERLQSSGNYDDFFKVEDLEMAFNTNYLKNVKFERVWFLNDSTNRKYDLVFFRNIALMYNKQLQEDSIEYLKNSMEKDGLLSIGIKESLPSIAKTNFLAADASEQIYVRI